MILYSDPSYGYREGIAMTQTQAFPLFKKFSLYEETPAWVERYNSTTTNTALPDLSKIKLELSMETAKDILERHRRTGAVNVPLEDALRAVEEIAEMTYDQFNPRIQPGCDCELCEMNRRKKSTFMKSLFPLKEI